MNKIDKSYEIGSHSLSLNPNTELENTNWKHKSRSGSLSNNGVEKKKTLMEEWCTLPKGLKLFLYLWERIPGCIESQSPNGPSDNETNHKLTSMVFELMSHDSSITLDLTFPP
jgi:hypothetical protein